MTPLQITVLLILLPLAVSFAEPVLNPDAAKELFLPEEKMSLYGEPCTKSFKCDPQAWLSCHGHGGKCDCLDPEEMFYSDQLEKCISKSGAKCHFPLNQQHPQLDLSSKNTTVFLNTTECVSNASCTAEGFCLCNKNFYQDSTRHCALARGYLEPCPSDLADLANDTSQGRCSEYRGLRCEFGRCKCDDSKSIYESSNPSGNVTEDQSQNQGQSQSQGLDSQCVGLADHPCINKRCIPNANCSNENVCICQSKFYPDSNGRCSPLLEPFSKCEADKQCLQNPPQHFVCTNGICNCNPSVSTYTTSRVTYSLILRRQEVRRYVGVNVTQCVGLVDTPCISDLCVPNAFCHFHAHQKRVDEIGVCKCLPPFSKTMYGYCGYSYGENCNLSGDCENGLVCKNLMCHCPYASQMYDFERRLCTSRIGGPCGVKANAFCGKNAECEAIDPELGQLGVGHCVCRDGFVDVEDSHGACQAGYGTKCRINSDCDSVAELQCIDRKCGCKTFAKYDGEKRRCLGLVGAKCETVAVAMKEGSKERNQCIQNAHCKESIHKSLRGSCVCNEGFEETQNYTCQLTDSSSRKNETESGTLMTNKIEDKGVNKPVF